MKTKKLGSVNAAILCSLYDNKNDLVGQTIDTPNAIAYAMAINTKVCKAVAHYALFGDTVTTREQVKDRFSWVVNEKDVHSKFLKWF